MPELPEVEVARRNLDRWWAGKRLNGAEVLDEKVMVDGNREQRDDAGEALRPLKDKWLVDLQRRAKLLIFNFADNQQGEPTLTLISHFKMTGKFVQSSSEPDGARAAFDVAAGPRVWFADVRRFGWLMVLSPDDATAFVDSQRYGVEPWPNTPDGTTLADLAGSRRKMIKTLLMDQEYLAGLGNIAASEVLFRARVHPSRKSNTLSPDEWDALSAAIQQHLEYVIEAEDADEIQYQSEAGAPNPFLIYGREGEDCPECGAEIVRKKIGSRSTFFCPECQG